MRHRIRTFLLVAWGLVGLAPAALAAGDASAVALSEQAATRAEAVSPPAIFAPATAAGASGQSLSLTATATDPDQSDVLTITETGAPASLAFSHTPSVSPASATLSGTLSLADVGAWEIDWQVTDGTFTETASTALTVTENHDPALTVPATVDGAVSVSISFAVLASDPDGDPLTSLTSSALPAGATFVANSFLTSGDFDWTPSAGQEGSYSITFTATSGSPTATANATTVLNIGSEDLPPIVTAPATVNGSTHHRIAFTASASDPDGEALTDFFLEGAQHTPLPDGAVFTANATNTFGTFTWTPADDQVGTVSLRWHVCDAEPFVLCTGPEQFTTKIIVAADRAPAVTAPAAVSVAEGSPLTVNVSAADPNGDAIASLTASGVPLGATFSAGPGNTAGTLSWIPTFSQAGSYTVTFTASNLLSGSAQTAITVTNANRAPTANPGGPYSGVAGLPVAFDGSASSDPDADALSFAWDFGDGGSATGPKPSHTYSTGGLYVVTLTVTDAGIPSLSNSATTTASITPVLDARVLTTSQYRVIKLQSGKHEWCAEVEPIGGDFSATDVDPSSFVLRYAGQEIHAIDTGKNEVVGDSDKNGLLEIEACFSKDDLRTLFAGLSNGHNMVTITIEGSLTNGAPIRGTTDIDVFRSGGDLLASVAPNPFNPQAKLTFVTRKPGALRVRLYDISGRLVRTLADLANAAPGNHEIHIDGRADNGSPLSSGTYFYRIEAAEGQETGRVSLLK